MIHIMAQEELQASEGPVGVVMCPTRELALQIDSVVATPGRFIQLLNERWTNLNRVTYVVLDEADEMLDQGFNHQVRLILSQVRPDRQMLMFSATWPKEVQMMAKEHCNTQ